DIARALIPVFQDPNIRGLAHHAKYDKHVLNRYGIEVTNLEFDTMIAAYLLGENSVGLKDLAFSRLGIEMTEITNLIGTGRNQLSMNMVPLEQVSQYACGDVEATFELAEFYRPLLVQQEQEALFRDIEMPLIAVLEDMERTGIAIDAAYLAEYESEVKQRVAELEKEITGHAGRPINVNSPKQLGSLLFDELKLPSGRKTKTGYSVDQDLLETLRDQHPIIAPILEYKTLLKLVSTYLTALPDQVNPKTGRIHTTYNQTVAATGRLASNSPNLQNIPIRTDAGRRVRRAFVADRSERRLFDDAQLLSADYSQIELRLMAHMSGEPFLVDAFRSGADIHRATASLVYGVDAESVTSDMRRVAKTVNFGLLYGMQAYGLSRDTGLSRAEAQAFIDQYWSRLPRVKSYFEETLKFGLDKGYVQSLYGRRRAVPDLASGNGQRRMGAERVAINMPLQGTAADIMKIAMIRVHDALQAHRDSARVLLQVHDELVLEVAGDKVMEIAHVVKSTMEAAATLAVPLVADVSAGPNWDDLTDLELNL
ncbi:MAG: DNA polymerase I, partial [Chloroflexota bacterium]|nr:DNA polymerase I [Chloroflexota bacterium]